MNNREKSERYEDLIMDIRPTAAAIGRREPYHLTYLKKYRGTIPQPTDRMRRDERKHRKM